MLNSEKSTQQIEKKVAALKIGKPYQKEALTKYITNTKETLVKAQSSFLKDKEICYFFMLKYLHMCTELRGMVMTGNSFANNQECFEEIVDVTVDYNDAAIVTEQLKKDLEIEYSLAREIKGEIKGTDNTPQKNKIRRSSSAMLDEEQLNKNLAHHSFSLEEANSLESVQEVENTDPKVVAKRFKDLVNKVRVDRRKSCA